MSTFFSEEKKGHIAATQPKTSFNMDWIIPLPPTEPLATERTRGDAIHSDWVFEICMPHVVSRPQRVPCFCEDERRRDKTRPFLSHPAAKLTQIDPLITCLIMSAVCFNVGGKYYCTEAKWAINRTKQELVKWIMSSGSPRGVFELTEKAGGRCDGSRQLPLEAAVLSPNITCCMKF